MAGTRLLHAIEYAALAGASGVFNVLPLSAALAAGSELGSAAYKVLRIRREVSESNAAAALGMRAESDELRRLCESCYRNLGMSLVELARLPRSAMSGLDRLVEVEGLEHFDRALCAGKGAVLATGHFGNWELMGAALAQRGYPMNFLVGHQSNRLVDRRLNRLRSALGIGIVKHGAHIREVLRLLRRNKFVAMLCDHDAGRKGLLVEFFGMPASSAVGPAVFSLRSGAPIIMGFISRSRGGRHKVELTPPIRVPEGTPPALAIASTTQLLADVIEERVRRLPDHWYWVHRRWKTKDPSGRHGSFPAARRPGGAPSTSAGAPSGTAPPPEPGPVVLPR